MTEDPSVSVVERNRCEASQGSATLEPAEELREGHHLEVGGEPAHLAFECLDHHVQARVSATGVRPRQHVVIAENDSCITPASRECRDAYGPEACIAKRG